MATEKNEMEKEIQKESKPCVKVILTLLLLTSTFWQNTIDQFCQEGRREMLTKADQLLCTISRRREKVSMMISIVMVMVMIASKKIASMIMIYRWRQCLKDLQESPTGRRSAGDDLEGDEDGKNNADLVIDDNVQGFDECERVNREPRFQ